MRRRGPSRWGLTTAVAPLLAILEVNPGVVTAVSRTIAAWVAAAGATRQTPPCFQTLNELITHDYPLFEVMIAWRFLLSRIPRGSFEAAGYSTKTASSLLRWNVANSLQGDSLRPSVADDLASDVVVLPRSTLTVHACGIVTKRMAQRRGVGPSVQVKIDADDWPGGNGDSADRASGVVGGW